MLTPFTKAGIDLILNNWQQGASLDDIVRALKTDKKAYIQRSVALHYGHVYNAVCGARARGDTRAIRRGVTRPQQHKEQNPKLVALFKRQA